MNTPNTRRLSSVVSCCALFLAVATAAQAQTKPKPTNPTDRGSMLVGGTASFVRTEGDAGVGFTNLSIVPNVQFFFAPRFAVGGELGVMHSSSSGFSSTGWLVGPAAHLFFGSGVSKTLPFLSAAVLWNTSHADIGNGESISTSGLAFEGSIGITEMLSRQVGITGEAFGRHLSNTFRQPAAPDNTSSANQFGVRFGITAFLF
jgi:hypothetical protein